MDELKDSPIGQGARELGAVTDCWGLLEPNLTQRNGHDEGREVEESVVGPCSWGLLEVLVTSFEEDERRQMKDADRKSSFLSV